MAKRSNRDSWLVPQTGHAVPQDDEAAIARSSLALGRQARIFVAHGPQASIMSRVEVLRRRTLGKRGVPLPGLRLSQVPQAGKSKTIERYITQLHERCRLAGLPHNPYRVLYIGLEVSTTIKMLCKRLLKMLGDPHSEVGNADDLKRRMHEFMLERGVELLIVDEVQHLSRESNDRIDVTDELKRLLDNGTVPLVLVGDEKSLAFFKRNQALAGRLGTPLELSPLRPSQKDQAALFKTFCHNLDAAMVAAGVFPEPGGLAQARAVRALLVASGGHIGRVCRIVEAAVEHAAFRDARRVEPYDLWSAVDTFAIPSNWVAKNPFEARAKMKRAVRIPEADLQPIRPLVVPVTPNPGESLAGLVAKSTRLNVLRHPRIILAEVGLEAIGAGGIGTDIGGLEARLAAKIGCSVNDVVTRSTPFVAGSSDTEVAFGGGDILRFHLNLRHRWVSPTTLAASNVHLSAWSCRLLPYCPQSLERLVCRCNSCGQALGWVSAQGIDVCEHCMEPLRHPDGQTLSPNLIEGYRAFASLISPVPAERDAARSALAREVQDLPQPS